jgi:hypothetical protein
LSKFFQIFNRLSFIKLNKSTLEYNNDFQGELLKAIMNSGTARNCVDKRSAYIFGNGFKEPSTKVFKINPKQTCDKFLDDTSNNVAVFKTISWLVKLDFSGNPMSVKSLPSQKIKVKSDGNFTYNHTFFTDNYNKNEDQHFEAYRPDYTPEKRAEQLKEQLRENKYQKGFIYYNYTKSIGSDYYAIPPAYSGIEDILTDHELSSYELENLQNGFLPSAILTLIGQVDDEIINTKTGLTDAGQLKKNLSQFTAKENGRSKLLVLTAETKDQIPNLQQMDVGKILEGLEKITDRIGRKVCRLFEVPPVLAGFEDASILGSNQTFKNALIGLQHSVIKDQELIIEGLQDIFPGKDFSISSLKLIDYIPQEVLAKLTDDELRNLAGYEPLPNIDTSGGVSLAETLGVGGTQALQGILIDSKLTDSQKVSILEILFNITADNANKMVYGNDSNI